MTDQYNGPSRPPGRIGAGVFLLIVGGVLLLNQMDVPLPGWLFNWHMLLIAVGIFIGLRHNFRGGAWIVMIIVGTFFMAQDYFPDLPIRRFVWPCVVIAVGLAFIIAPRRRWRNEYNGGHETLDYHKRPWHQTRYGGFQTTKEGYTSEDFIDSTAIFSGVHKKIVSKNFRGGDITSVMGGTEIDLTQADFNGAARLDITQLMGGTKLLIPPHSEVRSEVTAIFAGFEDKRQQPAVVNPEKVLFLSGTSIFGGIELKNY